MHQKTLGMVLGRSSITYQRLILHWGIIDEDLNGEIEIMAQLKKNVQFKEGERIVQCLLLPYVKDKAAAIERIGTFGRTGSQVYE